MTAEESPQAYGDGLQSNPGSEHESTNEQINSQSTGLRSRWSQAYASKREAARARRTLDAAWKIVILVVGLTVVAFGAFLLVFPGPGWPTIFIGLVILASEFTWATRFLEPVQRATKKVTDGVKQRTSRRQQFAIVALSLMASAAAVFFYFVKR